MNRLSRAKPKIARVVVAALIAAAGYAAFVWSTAFSDAMDHGHARVSANATLRVAPAFGAFVASAAVLRLARWLFDRAAELDLPDSDEAPLLPAVAVGWVRYVPWVVLSAAIMRVVCRAH